MIRAMKKVREMTGSGQGGQSTANELRASYQTNLGPAVRPGGEQVPGGPVPPYEGRLRSTTPTHAEHMRKVMSGQGGPPGPGRIIPAPSGPVFRPPTRPRHRRWASA